MRWARTSHQLLAMATVLPVAIGVACGEPGRSPAGGPRQVILIVCDALRADRLSQYGYDRPTSPELDRLASGGLVFEQHYANSTTTRTSLPNLFYSRYFAPPLIPDDPRVEYRPRDLFRRGDPDLVFFPKRLEEAGLLTALISAHTWHEAGSPFAERFQELYDLARLATDPSEAYPPADRVIDEAIAWLERNGDRDFFLYIHLMDTHFPHAFGPDARAFFGADDYEPRDLAKNGQVLVATGLDADDRRYLDALYDGGVRTASRQIGRLIDHLEATGRLDQTLIVLTADHGEHLLERPGLYYHHDPWLDPVAHIPLIIRYPGRLEPGRFHGLSEMVDVGPTILSLLGIEVGDPGAFDGRDLSQADRSGSPDDAVYARNAIRTPEYELLLRNRRRKLLGRRPLPVEDLSGLLYDRRTDPLEQHDLFAAEPERVAELVHRLRGALGPAFRRYQRVWVDRPPESAFAVEASDMASDHPLPTSSDLDVPPGWTRGHQADHSWLIGSETREPLAIWFPLPDGRYRLAARLQGRGRITVDGREVTIAEGQAYLTDIGPIEVSNQRFEASLAVDGDEPLILHYLSFRNPDATADDEETERGERLRALGYIE